MIKDWTASGPLAYVVCRVLRDQDGDAHVHDGPVTTTRREYLTTSGHWQRDLTTARLYPIEQPDAPARVATSAGTTADPAYVAVVYRSRLAERTAIETTTTEAAPVRRASRYAR